MTKKKPPANRMVIGWREWLSFPGLMSHPIKAKIDTGAKTSALYAVDVQTLTERGTPHVSFILHPFQRVKKPAVHCVAEILDERVVTSSNGHRHRRFVIEVDANLGGITWPIELTLADREMMGFRLLLGRQALKGRFLVDSNRSHIAGRSFAEVSTARKENKPKRKEK